MAKLRGELEGRTSLKSIKSLAGFLESRSNEHAMFVKARLNWQGLVFQTEKCRCCASRELLFHFSCAPAVRQSFYAI
jgi:hypothetical protein